MSSAASAAREEGNGVLYKPLLTHSLVVLRKEDPTSAFPYEIWDKRRVQMPNAAPAFLVEVKRAMFTDRKTDITFNNGMLLDIKVDKKSSINAFVDIPIRAVQVIIEIPTKALVISVNDAKNQAALIKTNQELISTIREMDAAVKGQDAKLAALTPEQLAALAAAGGVSGVDLPRAASNDARSLDDCLQNAVLIDPAQAEEICKSMLGQAF
jgi:hypothetical protein